MSNNGAQESDKKDEEEPPLNTPMTKVKLRAPSLKRDEKLSKDDTKEDDVNVERRSEGIKFEKKKSKKKSERKSDRNEEKSDDKKDDMKDDEEKKKPKEEKKGKKTSSRKETSEYVSDKKEEKKVEEVKGEVKKEEKKSERKDPAVLQVPKPKQSVVNASQMKASPMVEKDKTRMEEPKVSPNEQLPDVGIAFQIPKDEVTLESLELTNFPVNEAKLMEEYKIALQQIHSCLTMIMRRGNGTTDMENIKSEKHQAAAEKLHKEVVQTKNFWSSDKKLQPGLNDSIAKNSVLLAAVERTLQEKGPKHMQHIRKFIYHQYPKYAEMKRELSKVKKERPDSESVLEGIYKKMNKFIKEKYHNQKALHLAEMQCAFVEIGIFHRASAVHWYQISERKLSKELVPEPFDFNQFFKK